MRQDFVSWKTSHSLFLNTNYDLAVNETDHGTWRRLAFVNFPFKYVDPSEPLMAPNEKHGIPGLRDRVKDNTDNQLEAVLAWVVAGAMKWYENGHAQLPTPLTVKADTYSWRADADIILAYSMERLTFDPHSTVSAKDLYQDFCRWMETSGKKELSENTFSNRFVGHDLFAQNSVEKARIRTPAFVSRPLGPQFSTALPAQIQAYKGIRFN